MVQPLIQAPPVGCMVTLALRVIASLRASTRLEKRSKLAVFTLWLRTNSPKLGRPAPSSTTRIVMTNRSSGSVKPRSARMPALPARVAVARLGAGVREREYSVRPLPGVGDRRGLDGVGGRRGRRVPVRRVRDRDGVTGR